MEDALAPRMRGSDLPIRQYRLESLSRRQAEQRARAVEFTCDRIDIAMYVSNEKPQMSQSAHKLIDPTKRRT